MNNRVVSDDEERVESLGRSLVTLVRRTDPIELIGGLALLVAFGFAFYSAIVGLLLMGA